MSIWKQTDSYQAKPSVAGVGAFSFFNKQVWLVFQESIFWRGQENLALWKADGIGCLKKEWRVLSLWYCLRLGASPQVLGLSSLGVLSPKEIWCVWFLYWVYTHCQRSPVPPEDLGHLFCSSLAHYFLQNLSGMLMGLQAGPWERSWGHNKQDICKQLGSWEAMARLFWAQNYSHRRCMLWTCSFDFPKPVKQGGEKTHRGVLVLNTPWACSPERALHCLAWP